MNIAEDCDDNNQYIYPNADGSCNSKDDDCNGTIDDQTIDALPFYPDTDGDGFGDPNLPLYQCEAPPIMWITMLIAMMEIPLYIHLHKNFVMV